MLLRTRSFRVALTGTALFILTIVASSVSAEEIKIVGTGSGAPIVEALGAAFTQNNPGVTVEVPPSTGSGGAIKSVGTDQEKIGRVGRGLKENEKEYGLTYVPFSKVPIVFFVNKSVGVQNLTAQQFCDIYSGKLTSWKELGGTDTKIRVIRREDGDSSLGALLDSLPGFKAMTMTEKSKTTYSDPETTELVQNTVDTIAFGTYANAKNGNVDIITIDGKGPTDPGYQIFSTLALVFKEKTISADTKKFVEFATSPSAHETIKRAGGVPL